MHFLGFLALDRLKDLVIGQVFRRFRSYQQVKQDLLYWESHKRVPIIGWFVWKQRRPLPKIKERIVSQMVKHIRWFVNTSTFEDVLCLAAQDIKFKMPKAPAPPRPSLKHTKVIL